ncbi:MAG: UDP-N-acetylglucosamine 2-epimerase (non-hydrolyzing) [Crocinitomicaceae bacterium]
MKMSKKVLVVIGTRPNVIKITRFKKVAESMNGMDIRLVHTHQHFDPNMSDVFLAQFDVDVDHFIPQFKGTTNEHIAHIMMHLDAEFRTYNPDLVVVVGDVTSTLTAALTARNLRIPIAHLESGLRSKDMDMPEEINRILTDKITDYYFVTEPDGLKNLKSEGVADDKVFYVGNTMIDTLVHFEDKITSNKILEDLGVNGAYALFTMHRPSNVDTKEGIHKLCAFLSDLTEHISVVFPLHHRTKSKLETYNMLELLKSNKKLYLCPALDYFAFQHLIAKSEVVITDSGGIQEETTALQIPCYTLRENTERPVTITEGTNILMGFDSEFILNAIKNKDYKEGRIPDLWDGYATERVLAVIDKVIEG